MNLRTGFRSVLLLVLGLLAIGTLGMLIYLNSQRQQQVDKLRAKLSQSDQERLESLMETRGLDTVKAGARMAAEQITAQVGMVQEEMAAIDGFAGLVQPGGDLDLEEKQAK